MKGKKVLVGAGIVVLALVVVRLMAAAVWPMINDVRTGGTPEYPDLRPQRIARPHAEVFAAALASARSLGWEIVAQDEAKGEIRAVATTRLLRFKDDVTVTVGRDGEAALVDVRSRSRVGKGDLGTNARRIRRFQAELARRTGG